MTESGSQKSRWNRFLDSLKGREPASTSFPPNTVEIALEAILEGYDEETVEKVKAAFRESDGRLLSAHTRERLSDAVEDLDRSLSQCEREIGTRRTQGLPELRRARSLMRDEEGEK